MKKLVAAALASAAMIGSASAANAALIYQMDVTTFYQFGAPAGAAGYGGNPDTSFVTFTNSGPSTFVGTVGDTAVSQFAGDFSQSFNVTLASGASFTFGTSPESSNVGGFNGPFGSPQPGILLLINGLFGATSANLSVSDSNIHSGVFATNPFGVTLDNYVLQGGDPLGRDTGDGFEIPQAPGHFTFSLSSRGGVPEPATWAMMLVGFFGVGATVRRRRAAAAVA
jgi:hypothetical protein